MKATHSLKGAGIGLRSEHYQYILENRPTTPWFEALTDNYMGAGGLPLYHLEKIRQDYPIAFHGVGLSLGSTDPVDLKYLNKLKKLITRFQPSQISDHLAWVSLNQHYAHELLPFPYTYESLTLIADKINQIQDYIGTPILVENPSSYLDFNLSEMSEWAFIQKLVENTGCNLLVDINNIVVSARNNGFDALEYIRHIPAASVKEIHLAGYEDRGTHLYDTHGECIHQDVWDLYESSLAQFGEVPTLIEWDNDIPEFNILAQESKKAQAYLDKLSSWDKSA